MTMRYRDRRGDDDLMGTAGNDRSSVVRGHDTIDGGRGFDQMTVDYRGQVNAAPGDWSMSSLRFDGASTYGIISGGDTSSVSFNRIEQLTVFGSDAVDYVTVHVLFHPDAPQISFDAGKSTTAADQLVVKWYNNVVDPVAVSDDGVLTTAIGSFSGFEAITLLFNDGDDLAQCGAEMDYLFGDAGDDRLSAGGGDDVLWGGLGAGVLTGGKGADVFRLVLPTESRGRALDEILDFHHAQHDMLSVEDIDADRTIRGDQDFAFIGENAFSGASADGGELRQQIADDGTITVEGDVDRDGIADFAVVVRADVPLVASDVVL